MQINYDYIFKYLQFSETIASLNTEERSV